MAANFERGRRGCIRSGRTRFEIVWLVASVVLAALVVGLALQNRELAAPGARAAAREDAGRLPRVALGDALAPIATELVAGRAMFEQALAFDDGRAATLVLCERRGCPACNDTRDALAMRVDGWRARGVAVVALEIGAAPLGFDDTLDPPLWRALEDGTWIERVDETPLLIALDTEGVVRGLWAGLPDAVVLAQVDVALAWLAGGDPLSGTAESPPCPPGSER